MVYFKNIMLKKNPFKEKFFTAYLCLELLIVNFCLLVSQWLDHGASHQVASSLDSGDDSPLLLFVSIWMTGKHLSAQADTLSYGLHWHSLNQKHRNMCGYLGHIAVFKG